MTHTLRTFCRILRYAKPYSGRLAVGIVAGFVVGTSVFGMLSSIPQVLSPFEGKRETVRSERLAADSAGTDASEQAPSRLSVLEGVADRFGLPIRDADNRMAWQFMLLTILGLPLCVMGRAFATFVNRYCMRWVGSRVVLDVRNSLFDCIQRQSLAFFGQRDVGELISRCTNDTSVIENAISRSVADLSRAPLEILAAVGFILYYSVRFRLLGLVALLLVVFPLVFVPIIVLGRYIKQFTQRGLERIARLVSRMQETFSGIRVVKAFHMERGESARFAEENSGYFREVIRALRAELFMTPLMETVGVVCICAFVVVCYARGILLAQIGALAGAVWVAYKPTKQLAKVNAGIQRSVAAAERIFALLDTDTSLPESANPVRVTAFTDRVAFDSVSFRYSDQASDVLSECSFEMPRGSVVAFVGETGVGKTTVANLLARFYDPTGGRVTLDGVDLREIEVACLRQMIGIVTQETILFNDTVANNISYGSRNATREQIIDAATRANAHEFVMAEPEGYDRVVGERGFRLSGGEKQRIAIARAILKNPPILILDEATSALDTVTEQLVQEAINRVMQDRTVFAIAHRLSTIKHADLICLLQDGTIVERGTHDELYAEGGRYRYLCDIQFS